MASKAELALILSLVDEVSKGAKGIQRELEGVGKSAGGVQGTINGLANIGMGVLKGAFIAGSAAVGLFIGVGADAVKTAISMESAFAGVVKTTDGLTDGVGVLNEAGLELKAGFKALAEEKPISTESLMRIGELGGQLGIAKESLLEFTSVVADIGTATDLSTEEAAMGFAQLMNIMGTAQEDVGRIGAAIVDLGNNFATTEPKILAFAQNIAGAGHIAGLTEADVLGIGAAMSSVGIEAEAGGTAVQKVLLAMNAAVLEGGTQLETFASTAGLSAGEFASLWEKDAGAGFEAFVLGLGEQGDAATATLAALGLEDQRLVRSFLSLAGAGDLVSQAMDRAGIAWEENTALATEAAQRYATTESQMQMLRNQWRNMKDDLGSALLPALREFIELLSSLAQQYGPVIVAFFQDKIAPAIGSVATALGLLIQGDLSGALAQLFGPEVTAQIMQVATALQSFVAQVVVFVQEHAEEFKGALITIGAVLAAATIVSGILSIGSAITALANPIGIIIAAAALLGAAWAGNWGGIQEKTQAVIDWITPYIEAGLAAIRQFWDENGAQIMATVTAVWGLITEIFTMVMEAIKAVVSAALAAIQAWWAEHGDAVMAVIQFMWETIQTIFQTSLTTIQLLVQAVQAAIHGDWQAFGETLRAIVENIWAAVRDIFVMWFETLKAVVRDVVNSIVKIWTSVDWKGIGKDIIEGIKNGVISAAKSLANAAAQAAKNALNAAKAALGIHSPSRVAAEQIGVPFVQGIGKGIDQAMDGLNRLQMRNLSMQLVDGAQPRLAGATSQTTHTQYAYNLTIHTSAPAEPILQDFAMLQAMGGA